MQPPPRRMSIGWADAAVAALLAVLGAVLYLPRVLPGTGFSADTMKYHYIGVVLGISHPPGSPLYMLLDAAVARLPFGELAWRLNLFSAVCAIVATSCLYLLAREVSRSRTAASLAAVALIVAAMFWEQSLVAEVYTPHAVFFLASAWLLVRWHHEGRTADVAIAAALYGLSFGIHVMSWFLLPAWVTLTLAGPRTLRKRARDAALVACGALMGLSTYLYYVIRPLMHPAYVEFPLDGPRAFLDFVTGSQFRPYMFAFDTMTMVTVRMRWLADLAAANLGVPVLLLVAAGAIVLAREDRRLGIGLTTALVLSSLYAMGYSVPDAHVDALPALYLALVLASAGFAGVQRYLSARAERPYVFALTAAVVATVIAAERWDDVRRNAVVLDRSGGDRLARYADRVFDTVEPGSTILTGTDPTFHALAYHTLGLGRGRDAHITVISEAGRPCPDAAAAAGRFLASGPVYATMELTGCLMEAGYQVQAWDFSRTLPEYLASLPPGRIAIVVIEGEGAAGVDEAAWGRLHALGVLDGMRGHEGWSYAAVFVRTRAGFAGVSDMGERRAGVVLKAGDPIAGGYRAPVSVVVQSGGERSGAQAAVNVDGADYARSNRGVQVVVLDLATGVALERQAFDTHRTTSLRDLDFLRVIATDKP